MATHSTTVKGISERVTYTGLMSWLTTVDHKRIGVLYGFTAMFFFLVGGLEATVIRMQLFSPGLTLVTPGMYNSLFTMHALTMIFLAVMPLGAAFFNFIIPLQIGARDVAFPRLNAFSYWVFLFGALLLNGGWLINAVPDVGWFAYAPLTANEYSGFGTNFFILGLLVLGVSSVAAACNFIVTILNMRAPGMTLMRMPVFVWMTLIISLLLVFAFPVLTVGLIELLLQRFYDMQFFTVSQGGEPILWQHLFWIFGHPEVYILILPAMGIISDIIPTFAKKPLFGYGFVVGSGVAIAFLSFAVWAHHMFTTGLSALTLSVFSGATMLIAIPTGVKVLNWMATLWRGSLDLRTPMLFSIGFIATFVVGGLSGVIHASPPVDTQQQDTYFIVAHIHYVLFGGSIMGIFAGIYYWFPKVTGRMMNETLGKLHFWLFFIGINLTFGPMHLVGILGMPRRIYTYPSGMGWTFLNQIETIGVFIIIIGMIAFLFNYIRSARNGEFAGNDPWDGRTLEWTIPSPPPEYNFATIPVVRSREPLWDTKHPELGDNLPSDFGTSDNVDTNSIHMPNASYWPLVTGVGVGLGGALFLVNPILGVIGILITTVGVYAWSFEPAAPEGH
jgi:cytochrome c oxidase subunit 1